MDRYNPNLPLSFGITLWRFEEGTLFCITRGVKTRFRSVKICIEATFMDQFEPNVARSFGIRLGMLYGGQLFISPEESIPGGKNPFSVVLYKKHLYGLIQNIFSIKFLYNTVEVWGESIIFTPAVETRFGGSKPVSGGSNMY
jgi:hypothetical protein